jgi:hypothetical protein
MLAALALAMMEPVCRLCLPLCAACCSGNLVLTCGKDNLLRCVDVRRFEVRPVARSGDTAVLCCAGTATSAY